MGDQECGEGTVGFKPLLLTHASKTGLKNVKTLR